MNSPFCGRLGCGQQASSVLLISPQEREAWLVGLDHESAPEGVQLCETHADRITVPFGWALHNERTAPKRKRKRAAKPKKQAGESTHEQVVATEDAVSEPEPQPRVDDAASAGADAEVAAEAEPEAQTATVVEAEPEPLVAPEPVDDGPIDEPTIQLPAIDVSIPPPADPAPSDVPVNADHVAEAMAAADDPRHLQAVTAGGAPSPDEDAIAAEADAHDGAPDREDEAVSGPEPTTLAAVAPPASSDTDDADRDDDVQPSLWDDADGQDTIPSDRTPLLKRAFRVVSDD